MSIYVKENRLQLLESVTKSQRFLLHNRIKDSKINFFDSFYGAVYRKEATRLDNLWAKKTVCPIFTERLESFCLQPVRDLRNNGQFEKFQEFVVWYSQLGGRQLSRQEIELIYDKFKY